MDCRRSLFLVSILFTSLVPFALPALPQVREVAAGSVDAVCTDSQTMQVTVSDKAIINYDSFSIGAQESVRFVQPKASSCVLNRVVGNDPSAIYGKLSSNGKIFLVNPNGVYFGPSAQINAGSLIASTLDISDTDFLQERYHFTLRSGTEGAQIINEGSLHVSAEGSLLLLAPYIRNEGILSAQAGKVALLSGEKVTVDFTGDGLMSFSVEGALEKALIEHLGTIRAEGGEVHLRMRTAERVLEQVINSEGVVEGIRLIQEENGVIRLASESEIIAKSVGAEAAGVIASGKIDVAQSAEAALGGEVRLLGDYVALRSAQIDASGELGGGTVLIGGNYQGKGVERNALFTTMDEASSIIADAYTEGNGGKVILWADDSTIFNGKISARGGLLSGKGGFVETSGKENLGVGELANVSTLAPQGVVGEWLLDPRSIIVGTSGSGTLSQAADCTTSTNPLYITNTTINAATSNVSLCAQNNTTSSITVNAPISLSNSGIRITLIAGSTNVGPITMNANITTRGGRITFTGLVTLGATITLNTTNGSAAGNNISFSNTVNGAHPLTLNGGTGGDITMTGAVGGTTALTSLTATGATVTQSSTVRTTGAVSYTGTSGIDVGGNITTSGGAVGLTGPVTASGSPTIDSTNAGGTAAGANINFSSTLNGATAVTLRAGTGGIVTFSGAVGNTAPLTNLSFTSANTIQVGANVSVTGANTLTFSSPVTLTGTSTILSNNANIGFSSTLDGAQALTITGGSGTTTFTGAVGGTTPLTSLSATAATITQSSTAHTTGALSYTGSTAIALNGNGTTNGAAITLTGPVTLGGSITQLDATNGGGSAAGANISFSSTINGARPLTLSGGTGGTITLSGAVGGTTALTSLTATAAAITQSSTAKSTGALSYTASAINVAGNITTSAGAIGFTGPVVVSATPTFDSTNGGTSAAGANINFSSTLNGATALTLRAGTGGVVAFNGIVGGVTPLTNLSFTSAASVQVTNNITVSGANSLIFSTPVSLTGTSTILSNNADITFSSTLNGAQALTLSGGTGTTTFSSAVGATTPLTSLDATAATIVQSSTMKTTGAMSYTGSSAITLNGNIVTSSGVITLTGPVTLGVASILLDTTNGGLSTAGANIDFSSTLNGASALTVTAGTGGTITYSGAVGATASLSSLTASGAAIVQSSTTKTSGVLSYTATNISVGGNITTGGAALGLTGAITISGSPTFDTTFGSATGATITFTGTLNGATAATFSSGTVGNVAFTGAVGGITPLTNLTFTTANAVQIGSNVTVSGVNPLVFARPVSLTGASIMTSGGNNITFSSTLNGAQNLTLVAGVGNVLFSGVVGGVAPLTNLTFTSATQIQVGNNITVSGANPLIFSSPVSLMGNSTITSTNANINFNSTLYGAQALTIAGGTGTTTFTGAVGTTPLSSLSVTAATITQSSSAATTGAFSYTGSSAINLGGAVTTSGGVVTMTGAVVATQAVAVDTTNGGGTPAGGNITLTTTLNGAYDVTMTAGTGGTVSLGGAVGGVTPLNSLSISAATIGQASTVHTAGLLSYNGSTAVNLSGNITTNGGAVTVTGATVLASTIVVDATNAGGAAGANVTFNSTLNGSHDLTVTAGTGTALFGGAVGGSTALTSLVVTANTITQNSSAKTAGVFTYTGSSLIQLGGNVTTINGVVTMSGSVDLTGDVVVDSTNGGAAGGANISFSTVINGAHALTVAAGSGTITLSGAVGGTTPLTNLAFSSGALVQVASNITVSGANPLVFARPLSITGTCTITSNNANITFSSTLNGSQNLTIDAGTGTVLFSSAVGGSVPLTNLVFTNAALIQVGSNITVSGANPLTFPYPVSMTGTSAITTNNANLTFASTLNGGQALTVAGGTGTTIFTGAVGGTTPLTSLTVTAATITQSSSVQTTGAASYTGSSAINLAGNLTTSAGTVGFTGPVTISGTPTVDTTNGGLSAAGATVTFSATLNGAAPLVVRAGTAGNVVFNGIIGGLFPLTNLSFTSAASVQVASNITVDGSNTLTFAMPVTLTGTSVITSNNGNITFASTLNGAQALTLAGGTGTTTFSGAVGGSTALSSMTVTSNTITQNAAVKTSGAISYTGAAGINLAGNVVTSGGLITFTGPVAVNASLSIDATNGGASLGGNAISFSSTIDGDVANTRSLTLNSGLANLTFSGSVGSTTPLLTLTVTKAGDWTAGAMNASAIVLSNGVGTTTWNSAVVTTGASGIALTGAVITLNSSVTTTTGSGPLTITNSSLLTIGSSSVLTLGGNFLQNGSSTTLLQGAITGSGTVTFVRAVSVSGTPSISTAVAGKDITFLTVDGAGALTLAAGTAGDITFSGNIGSGTRLGAFSITSANNVTALNVTAASINQGSCQATASYQSIDTNGALGAVLVGNHINLSGTVTTTNLGPLQITNSGLSTLVFGALTSLDGQFLQDGAGDVSIQGTIATNNQSIAFSGIVGMTGNLVLNSGAGAGNISFSNTVDNAYNLTLTAGTGNITASADFGTNVRIGTLLVNSGTDMNFANITAANVNITESGGTLNLNGNCNTNTAAGITVVANNIVRGGSATATNDGAINVTFSGNVTASVAESCTAGYFSITNAGVGDFYFQGSITATSSNGLGEGVALHTPIILNGTTSFTTSATGANIRFYDTIDGTQSLQLTAGTGDIVFDGVVGGTTALGAVTISSAQDLTLLAFTAASITQTTGTGITTLNGAVTTSGASGISISSDSIVRGAAITTTGTGPLTLAIASGGSLTSTAAGAISLDGAFSQSGTGAVLLSGNITTTNDAISFSGPITLSGPVSLDSGAGLGNITFTTADGANDLTLAAGTGNIVVSGAVGSGTRIGNLVVSSCANLTVQAITASSINITESGGVATFNGDCNTNALAGVVVDVTSLVSAGNITTTSGGPYSATFTGSFSQTVPALMQVGSVSIASSPAGAGAVSFAGTIITDTAGVTLDATLTLSGAVVVNTSASNGAIALNYAIDGADDLTLTAGTGTVTLAGAVGSGTPVDFLVVSSASSFSTQAVSAVAITVNSTATTFNGALSTTGIGGIQVSGASCSILNNVTTTNSGIVAITHTGTLSIPSTSVMSLDGAFSETGGGGVSLGGNITTTNDNIAWSDAVTLTHASTLSSGVGAGNITFASTVDGAYDLTLTAGTGQVQFSAAVGTTPLNSLAVTAATIIQNAAVTTTSTLSYTGTVNLGANITTTNSNITITGNLLRTNTNSVTIDSGLGAGNISITGTVNGNLSGRNLTVTAGTGSVTFGGTIGGTIALQTLTVSADTITWANLGGASSGTGTTTLTATTTIAFTGTVYNNGTHSYTAGTSFTFSSPATITSNNLPITFTTGTIQLAAAADLTINSNGGNITLADLTVADNNVTNTTINAATGTFDYGILGENLGNHINTAYFNAGTYVKTPPLDVYAATVTVDSIVPIDVSADVTSPGAAITYNAPVRLTGDTITFSTCPSAPGANITFNNGLDGDGVHNGVVILDPCGNNVVFNSPVGAATALTSITIASGTTDVTIAAPVTTGSFSQAGGIGTTTIASTLTTTGASGVSIATDSVAISGAIATTNTGGVTIDVATALTISGADLNLDGAFQQTGTGAAAVSGSITTTGGQISFAGASTLNGALDLSSAGGAITFGSTITGATNNLSLTAGNGDITLTGSATGLGAVAIPSANVVNGTTLSAVSLTQSAATAITGKTTFTGAVTTSGLSGIQLTGTQFEFDGLITTTGNGPLVITNGDALAIAAGATIAGAFTQNGAGTTSLGGAFTVDGTVSVATATTLTATTSFDTSLNQSNISFLSTISGAQNLSFNLGNNGELSVTGAIGSVGDFAVTNSGNVTLGSVTANTIALVSTEASALGALTTSGAGGISLSLNSGSVVGNIITTSAGPVAITNTGTVTLTPGAGTSISGAFTQSGGGTTLLSGTLTTTNTDLSFTNAISLAGTTVLSTGAGSGNLTLGSAVNGTNALTLTAGLGSIAFGGSVGATTPVGAVTVVSCADIAYPSVQASSLLQSASSGTTTCSSAIATSGVAGISLTGTTMNLSGGLTTTGSGPVAITNAGICTLSGAVSSSSTFTQNDAGSSVNLATTITTTNGALSFGSPISLTAASALNSGSGGGNITLSGSVNGAYNLTVTAGTGSCTFASSVGAGTRIGTLSIVSGVGNTTAAVTAAAIAQSSGSTTFGALNTNTIAGISLIGTSFTLADTVTTTALGPLTIQNSSSLTLSGSSFSVAGAFSQSGAGGVSLASAIAAGGTIQFNSAISLAGTSSLTTTTSAISLLGTVNGSANLTLNSGSSDITCSQNMGGSTRLGALQITAARDVTTKAITASSITQAAGSRTTTIVGDINTNTAVGTGISLTGTNFSITGTITTTNNGACAIAHTGTLTLTTGTGTLLNGTFTESGAGGTVTLAGTIHAENSQVLFTNPITVTAPSHLNSNAGGDIIITSPVEGPDPLELTAGTGNISFLAGATVGAVTPVSYLEIHTANDVSTQAIAAGKIIQDSATGTTTFNGTLLTTTADGISLTGNNFVFSDDVTTLNSGGVTIDNAGLLSMTAISPFNLSGVFSQTSTLLTGTVSLCSSVTTNNSNISFASPVTLCADSALSSGLGLGDITFAQAVNGTTADTQSLSLTAGLGAVSLANIGATTTLNEFQILSCETVTAAQIHAVTIDIANVGTLGTFNGALSSSGVFGISIQGSAFAINAAVTTTNGGSIDIANTAQLTLSNTSSFTLSGGFEQTGTGAVELAAPISAVGKSIVFDGDVTLSTPAASPLVLTTGLTDGYIIFEGALNGGVDLTLNSASLEIAGHIGGVTPVGNLTLNGETKVEIYYMEDAGDVTATTSGIVILRQGFFHAHSQTYQGAVILEADTVISSAANQDLTITGTINGSGSWSLSMNTGGSGSTGNITLSAPIGETGPLTSLSLNSYSGAISLDSIGSLAVAGVTAGMTLTEAGGLSLTGDFYHTSGGVQNYPSGITIATSVLFNSENYDISFVSALDGTTNGVEDVSFYAGTGSVTFNGAIGSGTRLGRLQFYSADGVTCLGTVAVGSIHEHEPTGANHFAAAIDANDIEGYEFNGSTFLFEGPITSSNGGRFHIVNTALLQLGSLAVVNIDKSFVQEGGGGSQVAANITTNAASIEFTDAVTVVGGTIAFATGAGFGDILLSSTLNGASAVTLSAGLGQVYLNGAVGATTPLTSLAVLSDTAVSLNSIGTAALSGCGAVTVTTEGSLELGGAYYHATSMNYTGVVLLKNNVSMISNSNQNIAITGSIDGDTAGTRSLSMVTGTAPSTGSITVTGNIGSITSLSSLSLNSLSGSLTMSGVGSGSSAGVVSGMTIASTGTITLNGAIYHTSGGAQLYPGAVVLGDTALFNSSNENITFSSTINATTAGIEGMTILAGTGNVVVSGAVGSLVRLNDITISSAQDVTFSSSITTTSFQENNATRDNSFGGLFDATSSIGIFINGRNVSFLGNVITTNTGPLNIVNTGLLSMAPLVVVNLDGALTQRGGGTVELGADILTSNDTISFAGDVSLVGSAVIVLDTSTGFGDVIFAGAVDGAVALTAQVGTGQISFQGVVGGVTPVGSVDLTAGGGIYLSDFHSAGDLQATTQAVVSLSGTTYVARSYDVVGAVVLNNSPTITSGEDHNIVIEGDINGDGVAVRSLTLSTGTAASLGSITVTSGIGSTTALGALVLDANLGALSLGSVGTGEASGAVLGMTLTGDAGITLTGGYYHTSGSAQLYPSRVILAASTTMNSEGEAITFSSTVNGTTAHTENLRLTGGAGDLSFLGAVGSTVALGDLSINSAASVTVGSSLAASSIAESSYTGINSFSGSLSISGVLGVSLVGSSFTFGGPITVSQSDFTVVNTGTLTLPAAAPLTLGGNLTQSGGGAVLLGAAITAYDHHITITGDVTLTAPASSPLTIFTSSDEGLILFVGSVNGAIDLSLISGSVEIEGVIGGTTALGALTVAGETKVEFYGIGGVLSGAGSVHATSPGVIILRTGTYNADSHLYTGSVVLGADTAIQSGVDGSISITGNVDSDAAAAYTLSMTTGTGGTLGDILIGGGIGLNHPLQSIALDAQGGKISCSNIGSGSAGSLGGVLMTSLNSGADAIQLTGSSYKTQGAAQSFLGNVQLATSSHLYSTNQAITFASRVNGTTAGTEGLTLDAGTEAITFTGVVGDGVRIGSLVIGSAGSVTATDITAASILESNGTGANTFTGALDINSVNGISLNGSTFDFAGAVTTTNGGAFTINNSDVLTFASTASVNITGDFNQFGGGTVYLGAPILAYDENIHFTNAVVLTAPLVSPLTISSGPDEGQVVFNGSIDGAIDFSLESGSIEVEGIIGNTTPLGAVTMAGETKVELYGVGFMASGATSLDVTSSGIIILRDGVFYADTQHYHGNVVMTGDTTITAAGDVRVDGTMNGSVAGHSFTMDAGVGSVTITGVIGSSAAFLDAAISGSSISLEGIGGLSVGVSGSLTLTSSGAIEFIGTNYIANNQSYTAGTFFNINAGSATLFSALSGSVVFNNGQIVLADGSDLFVTTQGGDFTFPSLVGTSAENVFITLVSGSAHLGSMGILGASDLNNITVMAGQILLNQPIYALTINFTSLGSILNATAIAYDTTGVRYTYMNALGGSIGSYAAPISVVNTGYVLAGAAVTADFSGDTGDGTIHCLPSNPPPLLRFNHVEIPCNYVPPPSPHTVYTSVPANDFFVPGTDSSIYNLSNDALFMSGLIEKSALQIGDAALFDFSSGAKQAGKEGKWPLSARYRVAREAHPLALAAVALLAGMLFGIKLHSKKTQRARRKKSSKKVT